MHQNPGKRLDGGIAEDSKWQAQWEKLVCMPTQHCNSPSGKVRKRFVGIRSIELDRICARTWNAERVIVFQSILLQHAQIVNNFTLIRKCILFRLNYWNCRAFDKLVKYTYNSAMRYLGKARENQTEEQHHWTFLNLVQKGKLREAVQFVCAREKGGFLQPEELA